MPQYEQMPYIHFVAAISISTYRVKDKITHVQFAYLLSTKNEYVPHGRNDWYTSIYINKLLHIKIDPSG